MFTITLSSWEIISLTALYSLGWESLTLFKKIEMPASIFRKINTKHYSLLVQGPLISMLYLRNMQNSKSTQLTQKSQI